MDGSPKVLKEALLKLEESFEKCTTQWLQVPWASSFSQLSKRWWSSLCTWTLSHRKPVRSCTGSRKCDLPRRKLGVF